MDDYLNTRGRIFDVQRFSVHDGPGIRTIVFLKGCCLRCRWCCNPESQEYKIESMEQGGRLKTVGRDVTAREVLEEVERDRAYYRRSGGGLTLSGGECLAQPEFTAALLRGAKAIGLTTAIESTANAPWEVIGRILPDLDVFLMDIKHMDPEKHREFTGQTNERILHNAERIAREARRLIIRTPVIPSFNATVPEIRAIALYARSLPRVEEMHILPYHRLGRDKYTGLHREYLLDFAEPPSKELMNGLLETVKSTGLKAQIGG